MDDKIKSLMIRNTWEVVSSKSVANHSVIPGKWSYKCKRKPDWTIRKFKACYCARGDVQDRFYPEPLKSDSPVVQWATLMLIFIFKCNLGL